MNPVKTWLGYPYPLGATWMGNGVNFALFSEDATGVDLCLFDNLDAPRENVRIPMTERTDQIWHVFLPEARPGQLLWFSRRWAVRPIARPSFQFVEAADRSLRKSDRGRRELVGRNVWLRRGRQAGGFGAGFSRRRMGYAESGRDRD
jgi:pullulanase/glycogen debranching enzyme